MRRVLFTLAFLAIGLVVPTEAQAPTAAQRERRVFMARIDQMRAVLNVGTDWGNVRSAIDWVGQINDPSWGRLHIFEGWAVSCQSGANGYPQAIDIELDEKLIGSSDDFDLNYRIPVSFLRDRPDVRNILAAYPFWAPCVPAWPGFTIILDTNTLSNSMHHLRIRVWDTQRMSSGWSDYAYFLPVSQ
jgi:hypothetical protein